MIVMEETGLQEIVSSFTKRSDVPPILLQHKVTDDEETGSIESVRTMHD